MVPPDLIVGVDFGMTYTGVAYALPSAARQTPRPIQRWPGMAHRDESKVPTRLVYNIDSSSKEETTLSSWGFLCSESERNDPNKQFRDWFKLQLQSEVLRQKNQELADEDLPTTTEADVKRWFEEYLSNIYKQTEQEISRRHSLGFWKRSTVVFIFSVPTTWTSHAMIQSKFKDIILRAGFGSVGPNHTIEVGLTEAEAAAVYTADAGQTYQVGEVILVCDAGGGTTDASVHKVSSMGNHSIELDALLTVQGLSVGSAAIDRQFIDLAQQRLQCYGYSKKDSEVLASAMMEGEEFQSNKCLFGDPDSSEPRDYELRIPELELQIPRRLFRNQHQELKISRAEMQCFFDSQIHEICELIDNLLYRLQKSEKHSLEKVSKLILSGGLGSSHYVQQKLASKYRNTYGRHENSPMIDVVLSDEPQLAVVKGLVINRLQQILYGRPVLRSRCCRASYGIVCDMLWNKSRHKGQERYQNILDKRYYVRDQICWLIKQGDVLSENNPIQHTFFRRIEPDKKRSPWSDKIVSSTLPLDRLPERADDEHIHCTIVSDLTHIPEYELDKANFHKWNRGVPHYRLSYTVKVIIEAAHIWFELWYNEKNYTKAHPIAVEWGNAAMEFTHDPAVDAHGLR